MFNVAVTDLNRALTLWVGEGGRGFGEGGGGSYIFIDRGALVSLPDLLGVAGGGGGGASDGNSGNSWSGGRGGAGGWERGQSGQDLGVHQNGTVYAYCQQAQAGAGGTRERGGSGGTYVGTANGCEGTSGTSLQGGAVTSQGVDLSFQCVTAPEAEGWRRGRSQGNGGGGAGGGGYFGGGSGGFVWTYCGGGGGGGSSWLHEQMTLITYEEGVDQLQGMVENAQGAGHGGARDDPSYPSDSILHYGADGRIEIGW